MRKPSASLAPALQGLKAAAPTPLEHLGRDCARRTTARRLPRRTRPSAGDAWPLATPGRAARGAGVPFSALLPCSTRLAPRDRPDFGASAARRFLQATGHAPVTLPTGHTAPRPARVRAGEARGAARRRRRRGAARAAGRAETHLRGGHCEPRLHERREAHRVAVEGRAVGRHGSTGPAAGPLGGLRGRVERGSEGQPTPTRAPQPCLPPPSPRRPPARRVAPRVHHTTPCRGAAGAVPRPWPGAPACSARARGNI